VTQLLTGLMFALWSVPVGAAEQAPARQISGVVVDAEGLEAPGVPVMLHRMGEGGGGLLAADTTDGSGRFAFALPEDDAQALHFAAASAEGVLFVGPVLAPGAAVPDPYRIRLRTGLPAGSIVLEEGSVLSPVAFGEARPPGAVATAPPADDPRPAALAMLGVVAILLAAVVYLRRGARGTAFRRAIVELAELGEPDPDPSLVERRAELRERAHALRPR
jgi:hypothetical protein